MSGRFLLGMGASKKAAPITSLVSALTNGSYSITLTWTNPDPSLYSTIVVERSIDGGGYSVVATLAVGTVTYTEYPGYSVDVIYRIKTTKSGGVDSDYVTATTRRTLPAPPSINSFYRNNTSGTMTLDANSPGHSKISGFDVEISTNNGSSWNGVIDSGADPDYTWSGVTPHWNYAYARVRTRDTLSQVSGWVTSGQVQIVNDTTAPSGIGPITLTASGRGVLVSFAAPTDASGIDSTVLQIDTGGGFFTIANFGAGGASNWYMSFDNADRGKLVSYRLWSYDIYGNGAFSATANFQTAPLGTFYAFPGESASWKTSGTPAWRSDTNDVVSGYLDATYATQTGAWFYGTAFYDICKGHTPDSASLFMERDGSSGSTGPNNIRMHSDASRGGYPTLIGSADAGPTLSGGQSTSYALPGGWLASIGNAACRGIAAVDSGSYRRLNGITDNVFSGLVTIVFN